MPRKLDPLPPESRQRALADEINSLIDVVEAAPLINLLIERSFELSATDVHFDPRPDGLAIRLRLDGVMHDVSVLPQQMTSHVLSRLKLMSGMNITERRLVQDGHITSNTLRKERDIRVCAGPTIHGERLVLRLMPDGDEYSTLASLGMDDQQRQWVESALSSPYGMVLSVGPVGTGKSTTTYSCLNALNIPGRSLVTIEDPVERRIAGVNQIQTDPKISFGFKEALRGILRQDPDVIMVGEIRDAETAHIAVRAGLTGIRVVSTLHASDTAATIDLFNQFEIPRMFIADSINCLIAQRLLRKVCGQDRETYKPEPSDCKLLRLSEEEAQNVELVRGKSSSANFHSGYFGRTGVFEVMRFDEAIREMISTGRSGREIFETARSRGMKSLEDMAIEKVLAGITTTDEMVRVLWH
ncbi:MAG: GspE/PulE family protein [Planctomycetaceae bacterium]